MKLRFRLSYKAQLLIGFTIVFAAFALLLVLFQQNREQLYRVQLLEERLDAYACMVDAQCRQTPPSPPNSEALTRLLPRAVRLTVIDARSGSVLCETAGNDPDSMDNHGARPEVLAALREGHGMDIRQSATRSIAYFYYARNFSNYVVRLALPYETEARPFLKADNVFLWFVLMVFPLVLVCLIYLADHFGKNLAGLRRFIEEAEAGRPDFRAIRLPPGELGDVGRTIMSMYRQTAAARRKAETERARLKRHFHYFEEGIAIFTPDRKLSYANPRFFQYANSLLSRPTANMAALWSAEAFAPAREFLDRHASNQPSAEEEPPLFRYTWRAGGACYAIRLLVHEDGDFEITLADVTEEEKNRLLKQQMSNNITHELRTPLSSIRGYLETIVSAPSLSSERVHHFAFRALGQAERLTDLIRDVALISKMEEAPDTLPREMVCPAQIVTDIVEEFEEQIEEQDMRVRTRFPEALHLKGNYSLVYSIFRNLVENAVNYAGRGALIHVECYKSDAEYCYFVFYDTGKGVAAEHLPRLFERFYRAQEGRTRQDGGTGLGLSIVRNAVAFHRGEISVRNRKGGGLEFLFSLARGGA